MSKTFLILLFLFTFCNMFLLSEDIEVEKEIEMNGINDALFRIRQEYIYFFHNSHIDNSREIVLSDIDKEIGKLISYFHTLNEIIFENDTMSLLSSTMIEMIIIELNYIQQINNDIECSEYGSSRIFHSLYNVIQLCTLVRIINENE